jgi:hypothetical protein
LAKPFVVPLGTVVTYVFSNTVHCTYNPYQPAIAMYINNVCQSYQYKQWLLNPLLCRQMYAYWQCCSLYCTFCLYTNILDNLKMSANQTNKTTGSTLYCTAGCCHDLFAV